MANDTTQTAARVIRAPAVAERYDLSLDRVYELAREGRIPAIRLGKQLRFSLEQLAKWEAAGGAVE
jgi:excisionase family DNA binding protein